jgi:hypothetical protein
MNLIRGKNATKIGECPDFPNSLDVQAYGGITIYIVGNKE